MFSHNIKYVEIRKIGGNKRKMISMYIAAMIFNLSKCFSVKFAENLFLNHECRNKVYQLATVNFR